VISARGAQEERYLGGQFDQTHVDHQVRTRRWL
jgi:hypothetical protein